jgi:hypothetical protein
MQMPMPVSQRAPVRPSLARMSASIIIDQHGVIRSCGPDIAALGGLKRQTLNGQPVKSLLPTLPFKPGTPGYNVAFAVFHANTRRRTICIMKTGTGAPVPVDVSLTVLEATPVYLFNLEIRKHETIEVVETDASAPIQQQAIFRCCA